MPSWRGLILLFKIKFCSVLINMYARTNVNLSQGTVGSILNIVKAFNYKFISQQTYLLDEISN